MLSIMTYCYQNLNYMVSREILLIGLDRTLEIENKLNCSINGTISRQREIKCGVPQGSNLGPMLFLLYINDLPHCLKTSKSMLLADDTNLSCDGLTSREIEAKLNTDLVSVDKWLSANKLTLNNDKTECIIIG